MPHEHSSHSRVGHHHLHGSGRIGAAFLLNLAFTIAEFIGGYLTNSMAIVADALHDLGDSFSLGMAWFMEQYAQKEADRHYSYGYGRFSLLTALINTLVLVGGSTFVLAETIPRLLVPEPASAKGMLIFALVGIGVNGLAALRLKGAGSLNARVVAWHLLEDVLGWAAVLVVSIVLLFRDVYILDPILSILVTAYILYHVIRNLRRTATLFLQAVPEDVDLRKVEKRLEKLPRVSSTHHTHVWSLDGEHHVLSTHVVVDPQTNRQQAIELKQEIRKLMAQLGLAHSTVEIEYGEGDCCMDRLLGPQD